MGLSKREREEFARITATENIDWDAAYSGARRRTRVRWMWAGGVGLGFAVLVAAVVMKLPVVGVVGFVVALSSAVMMLRGGSDKVGHVKPAANNSTGVRKVQSAFMDKVAQRWDRRREQRGR